MLVNSPRLCRSEIHVFVGECQFFAFFSQVLLVHQTGFDLPLSSTFNKSNVHVIMFNCHEKPQVQNSPHLPSGPGLSRPDLWKWIASPVAVPSAAVMLGFRRLFNGWGWAKAMKHGRNMAMVGPSMMVFSQFSHTKISRIHRACPSQPCLMKPDACLHLFTAVIFGCV